MNAALNFAVFSLSMAAATVFLYVLSRLAGKRFSSWCKYEMWSVLIIRMCLPFTFLPSFLTYETPYVSEAAEEISPSAGFEEPSFASASAAPRSVEGRTPTARPTAPADGREREQTPKILSADVLIPTVYFGVCALIFVVRLAGYGITMRKIRRSLKRPDPKTEEIYRRLIAKEKVRRAPELFVSERIHSPMLCGLLKRRIVLTEAPLSGAGLDGVLRHELTHHARGDLVMKLVGTVCLCIHFWNPAAYAAVWMMDREMEYSCDERALSCCGSKKRRSYGAAVLKVLKTARGHRLGAALTTEFVRGKKDLGERFSLIMDVGKKKRGAVIVAAALIICIIAGSAVSFRAAAPFEPEAHAGTGISAETEDGTEPPETEPAFFETEPPAATATDADPANGSDPSAEILQPEETERATEPETEAESTNEPEAGPETEPETAGTPVTDEDAYQYAAPPETEAAAAWEYAPQAEYAEYPGAAQGSNEFPEDVPPAKDVIAPLDPSELYRSVDNSAYLSCSPLESEIAAHQENSRSQIYGEPYYGQIELFPDPLAEINQSIYQHW